MGAWGSGPFDNDDAADWRYSLVDGGGPEIVAAALGAVLAGAADLATAGNAVAAAAVVGAGLRVAQAEVPDDVRVWLAGQPPATWPPLAFDAVRALDQVLTRSELRELWGEADDDSWAAETRALRDRIAVAGGAQ